MALAHRTPYPALVTALAMTVVSACNVGEARIESELAGPEATPLPVQSAPAEIADLYAHYQATSTIAADGEADVPARVSGQVLETLAEEGDRVQQGQLLARIDGERQKLLVRRARAQLAERQNEYERLQNLHKRGLVSKAAFESLKYDVDELKAAHELEQLNLSYSEVRAPISGIVSARHIRTGQHATAGDLAFRITDTSRLIATLQLPQVELAHFRDGLDADVTVDACPDQQFTAHIERISPVVDKENGTFRATVYIDNNSQDLAPGMFARFRIYYEKFEDALVVPARSVVREDDELVVYRIQDGIAERRTVAVGIESDGRAQILSGLLAGDEVITSNATGIQNGTQVAARNAVQPATGD